MLKPTRKSAPIQTLLLLTGMVMGGIPGIVAQCSENIILNPGFEEVGPPCGAVPPGGLINAAFNNNCVPGWQAAWGTPSVCAFGVFMGNHVACFGSNNEGMCQEVALDPDPCSPYTLSYWYRGISGFSGNLHVYLANGLVNVPTSNSGNPPLVIQPDWDLLTIVPVSDNIWRQAVVNNVQASDPANTQLLFLDVPTGTLDVSVDEVFLGTIGWDPVTLGFSILCVEQTDSTYTFEAVIENLPSGLDPDDISWTFGDGGSGAGEMVTHTFEQGGTYEVCATLVDLCGCPSSVCETIMLDECSCACGTDDLPPLFETLPPLLIEVECLADVPAIPVLTVVDACDDAPTVLFEETTVGTACDFTLTRVWTAADACGNTSIAAQVIRVADNVAPDWIVVPTDILVPCEGTAQAFEDWADQFAGATAEDNCGDVTLSVEALSVPSPDCQDAVIVVSATDGCGNVTSQTATFRVDASPPEILLPALDLVSACGSLTAGEINTWLADEGGALAAIECGEPTWQNDFAGDLSADSTLVTFTATNACLLQASTSAWLIQADAPAPMYDTVNTCDPDLAGIDTTEILVGNCLVPVYTTALYRPGDTTIVNELICDGDPLQDTTLYTNRYGCDSLVFLIQTLVSEIVIESIVITCRPDTVGPTTIVVPGTPCDTLIRIAIIVPPPDFTFLQDTVCDPALAGTEEFMYTNQSGCDSIVIVDRIYVQPMRMVVVAECGPGDDYTDTLTVPAIPCDSLIITAYTYYPDAVTLLTDETCDPAMTGPDTTVLATINGCDSLVVTNTTLVDPDTTRIELITCTEANAGIDTFRVQNAAGCDSLIILNWVYAGIDTLYLMEETCDPALAGTTITVRPGTVCDTIVQTETALVQVLTTRDTTTLCGQGPPVTDTLVLQSMFGCDSLVLRTTIFTRLLTQMGILFESCAGAADGTILVEAVTGGVPPYSASLNNGPFIDEQAGRLPSFDDLPPGVYTVIVRDAAGCRDTIDNLILQPGPTTVVSAGADIIAEPGAIIELSGTSSPSSVTWQWTATDPLSCDTCLSTQLGPLTVAQWAVLSGMSANGCTDADSVRISLQAAFTWFIPNVFSPNGDGINDSFAPTLSDGSVSIIRFDIHDRWGGLLFALTRPQSAGSFPGWDGTMNGQPAAPGVYVYVMEFGDPGQEIIRVAGDVTLLR